MISTEQMTADCFGIILNNMVPKDSRDNVNRLNGFEIVLNSMVPKTEAKRRDSITYFVIILKNMLPKTKNIKMH